MSYKTLYRQWRPQKFKELVGQDHIAITFKNAFQSGKIAHAYLLAGPRGTGKTSTAKIIAKAANCLDPTDGEPCDKCQVCTVINQGNSLDINEIDGASNRGIDEIRDLREKVKLSPAEGRYKVYTIDEVHMLTGEAFNALLKTLEEPPAHVIFILATTEPHKMPPTVLSRCQRFDFKRLSVEQMAAHMEIICSFNEVDYDRNALFSIARFADGAMRDSLSILDQCLSHGLGSLKMEDVHNTLGTVDFKFQREFIDSIIKKDIGEVIIKTENLVSSGKDLLQFSSQAMDYLHNLLLLKVSGSNELLKVSQEETEVLAEQSEKMSQKEIVALINALSEAEREMKRSSNSRLIFEIAVVRVLEESRELEDLEKRVSRLESLAAGKDEVVEEMAAAKADEAYEEDLSEDAQTISDSMLFNKIKGDWSSFLKTVKKKKITIYAFLVETAPLEIKDDRLILSVPAGYNFHKEKLEQRENNEAIKGYLEEFFGRGLRVEIKISPEKAKNGNHGESHTDSKDEHFIVKETASLFEGSIID